MYFSLHLPALALSVVTGGLRVQPETVVVNRILQSSIWVTGTPSTDVANQPSPAPAVWGIPVPAGHTVFVCVVGLGFRPDVRIVDASGRPAKGDFLRLLAGPNEVGWFAEQDSVARTLVLSVRGPGAASGRYNAAAWFPPSTVPDAPWAIRMLARGDSAANLLHACSPGADTWALRGAAGDSVAIEATSQWYDVDLELRDSTGQGLARSRGSADARAARISVVLPASGVYRIVVQRGSKGGEGQYRLTVR